MKNRFIWGGSALGLALVVVGAVGLVAFAQKSSDGKEFSLQVTPSTLIESVKPGVPKDLELKVFNNGKNTEHLKAHLLAFDLDKETGDIELGNKEPEDVSDWVTFSQPFFSLEAGKSITEKIHVDLPQETGFTYSFAVVISKTSAPDVDSGAALSGSVVVFTLLTVDRPGAERKFEVTEFRAINGVSEYLPVDFEVVFKNTGNTYVRPAGNVFIKKNSSDSDSLATLLVNNKGSYLLPDRPRTLYTTWTGGFPEYKTVKDSETGETKRDLVWDWSKLGDFRIGQYTAKLVAVYNDGTRDVPVVMETTFWVFPWRIILSIIVLLAIFVVGMVTIWRKTHSAAKKLGKHRGKKSDTE